MDMEELPYPYSGEVVIDGLARLFRSQGVGAVAAVLEHAHGRVVQTRYDNWDGGTYYYTLYVDVPIEQFATIEPTLRNVEDAVAKKFRVMFRPPGNLALDGVVITAIVDQSTGRAVPVAAEDDVKRIWGVGGFRLFLSHVSSEKAQVGALKQHLSGLAVSAFVAHEDIEPSREWLREIDLALASAHALAALLTPGFHESRWTDQEIGIALGRGVTVIPVRLGIEPYGFIARQQALAGRLGNPKELAADIASLLSRNPHTAATRRSMLVRSLETSRCYVETHDAMRLLQDASGFTPEELARLEAACIANDQVGGASGIRKKVADLVARERATG